MAIGSTIRQLRQEQDITQEQLAEALGITSRAVSQWETDRTSPDISQLPALANFFDVTTDRLLGLDIKRKQEELDKIYVQINKYNEIGDQKGLEEYIREQLKIYPNNPNLLTHLAFALQNYYFGQGKADTEEFKKEKSNEIIILCERALKYYKSTENNSFPKQLIIHYIYYLHDKEKAKEIVMSLPNVGCTREMFLGDLYEGKEALERRQAALLKKKLLICLKQHTTMPTAMKLVLMEKNMLHAGFPSLMISWNTSENPPPIRIMTVYITSSQNRKINSAKCLTATSVLKDLWTS